MKLDVAVVALLVLSACGSNALRSEMQRIAIADQAFLVLPGATDLTASFDAVQAISAEYENRSFSFEAHIRARPGSLSIVALGPLGGALFSIRFDGVELVAEGAERTRVIAPEYVLADVLLTHWDVDWLRRRLDGADIETSAGGAERIVTRNGRRIIGISFDSPDPWGGRSRLTHVERGYVLDIATAEFSLR